MNEKEKLYSATMAFGRTLLRRGLLTKEEYRQIDTILTKKYAVRLAGLFSDIGLITYQCRGNI